MNHGQQTGEVALSSTSKEQPEVQRKIKQNANLQNEKTKVNSKLRQLSTLFDQWELIAFMPTDREEVNREPLTPPKVERATEMGMIHDMTPSSFSPNV